MPFILALFVWKGNFKCHLAVPFTRHDQRTPFGASQEVEIRAIKVSAFIRPNSQALLLRTVEAIMSLPKIRKRVLPLVESFKEAQELFFTRRLVQAMDVIEHVVAPTTAAQTEDHSLRGNESISLPLVVNAERKERIRVLNLYIMILNAIIELGPEIGKRQFGSARWKALIAKVQNGTVWDEIVKIAYNGSEGSIDPEIVTNLSTLLVSHSTSQLRTQHYIESWMASAGNPKQLSPRHRGLREDKQYLTTGSFRLSREMRSRLKIVEIYTLEVLPRNAEWLYATEFVSMSDILDADQKDELLETLQALRSGNLHSEDKRDMPSLTGVKKPEQESSQAREIQQPPLVGPLPLPKEHSGSIRDRVQSERDFGIDDSVQDRSLKHYRPGQSKGSGVQVPPTKVAGGPERPMGLQKGNQMVLNLSRRLLATLNGGFKRNPSALLRLILVFFAIILVSNQRSMRSKLERLTSLSWTKTKKTIGMGVKVSYI